MRKERILATLTKTPFIYITISSFVIYLLINGWINDWHIFIPSLLNLFWYISISYALFGIIIALMVAIAISLTYMRVKELQKMSGASGLTFVGVFFGVMTGACPGCLVGILPAIAGFFGGAITLSELPWHGIEVQLLTIGVMSFAIYSLAKDNTCKIKQ